MFIIDKGTVVNANFKPGHIAGGWGLEKIFIRTIFFISICQDLLMKRQMIFYKNLKYPGPVGVSDDKRIP